MINRILELWEEATARQREIARIREMRDSLEALHAKHAIAEGGAKPWSEVKAALNIGVEAK